MTSTWRPSTCCRRSWRNIAGTVLLVSHDRDFLDRVVTSIVASEGNGSWVEYAGGYPDMLAQRGAPPAMSRAKSGPVKRPRAAVRGAAAQWLPRHGA